MQIRSLTFLLLFQPFYVFQWGQEMVWTLETTIGLPPTSTHQQQSPVASTSAANIILKSVDGGKTWQDVSEGLPDFFEASCVFVDRDEIYLGAGSGLYRGSAVSTVPMWETEALLDNSITEVFHGHAGPFVCSSGNGFFRESPGTGIWVPMHNTLIDKTVRTVLETSEGNFFVGCDSGIFKSSDSGKSWKQVFDEGRVTSLVAVNGVLVGGGMRGVLRSTDGGEHWDWAMTDDGAVVRTGLIEGGVAAITYNGFTKQVQTSADNGETWHRANDNDTTVQFLYDIKQSGEYLFYSQDAGVFRSSDRGQTWQLVLPSTRKNMYYDLAVMGKAIFAVKLVGC